MTRNTITAIAVVAIVAIGAAVGMLFEREPTPLEFQPQMGVSIISPPVTLPDVPLVDQNGNAFGLGDLKGRWSLLFFGFTHCPDVCPTALANMAQLAKIPENSALNYVFVTLDPSRDTPEKLKEYVGHFNPAFKGITGERESIDRLAETAGVIYEYEGDVSSGAYNVNHYAAILVLDPKGRLRAHILPPHPTTKMASVMAKIRQYYGD